MSAISNSSYSQNIPIEHVEDDKNFHPQFNDKASFYQSMNDQFCKLNKDLDVLSNKVTSLKDETTSLKKGVKTLKADIKENNFIVHKIKSSVERQLEDNKKIFENSKIVFETYRQLEIQDREDRKNLNEHLEQLTERKKRLNEKIKEYSIESVSQNSLEPQKLSPEAHANREVPPKCAGRKWWNPSRIGRFFCAFWIKIKSIFGRV